MGMEEGYLTANRKLTLKRIIIPLLQTTRSVIALATTVVNFPTTSFVPDAQHPQSVKTG